MNRPLQPSTRGRQERRFSARNQAHRDGCATLDRSEARAAQFPAVDSIHSLTRFPRCNFGAFSSGQVSLMASQATPESLDESKIVRW
jgi:hypothetical protein